MFVRTNVVGFNTIVIREFSRILRIWAQTIVPPAITATLYFIIFGSLIGRRIGDMGGYSYMQYIAPGLIMMSVITNSYGNVVSSFFGAKFGKHIEELLVSPLPNWLIVAGYMMGGIGRGLIVGAVVTIIPTFVLTPLIYLGGVFYSIDLLAPTWRMLSKIDPILYMVNAFRYGFLGVSDISIGIAYGIICTFLVVLFSVALYLLNKGTGLRS
jgi:ABC-2 type transport system permease protein